MIDRNGSGSPFDELADQGERAATRTNGHYYTPLTDIRQWRIWAHMDEPLQTVAETDGFIGDCDEAGVDGQQRLAIVKMIARDPNRLFERDRPVYLLALLSKGDAGNFDDDDIAEMKKFMTELKAAKPKRKG